MSESSLEVIARNVRRRRRALGLSQEGLAEKAGLHRTFVGGVERGERNLTVATLDKLAHSLGCTLIELVSP